MRQLAAAVVIARIVSPLEESESPTPAPADPRPADPQPPSEELRPTHRSPRVAWKPKPGPARL
ncbi:MAG TPA: hypothetical protein VH572_10605 [Gaiella sp.]|jgi:hypothetical protein